jgi:hypothetical protein
MQQVLLWAAARTAASASAFSQRAAQQPAEHLDAVQIATRPCEHSPTAGVCRDKADDGVAGAQHEPLAELDAAKVALSSHRLAHSAREHALGEGLQPSC